MAKSVNSDFGVCSTILKVKIWQSCCEANIVDHWKSAGGKKPVNGFCTPLACLLVWEALRYLGNLLLLGEMNVKFSPWLPNSLKLNKFNLTVNCSYI